MSPLPERLADRTSFIHDEELIDNFFKEPIGADKIWRLHAYDDDPDKLEELIKSLGVDFDVSVPAIESYESAGEGGNALRHKVYVTAQKGVYLDLISGTKGKLAKTVFVRLGENINRGYFASLRNE